MKIIVLIKEVPDTYGQRVLDLATGLAERTASEPVLDEIGERAIEAALAIADASEDVEVVLVSMAPDSAQASIRKGLAMGAGSAVQVVDDDLRGADLGLTAQVIAATVRRIGFDLVIAGNVSTDGGGGVLPAMLAELLEVPHLSALSSVSASRAEVAGERALEAGSATVRAELPAVISITERMPDARFPNFKGIMAAKKKPIETLSLADLAIVADDPDVPRSIAVAIAERPPRAAGVKIVDQGDAGALVADFLIANRLA